MSREQYSFIVHHMINTEEGCEEMAQQLRESTILAVNLGLVPNTQWASHSRLSLHFQEI